MAYSQNDPRWKNDKLGKSKSWTMGEAGCFVTSGSNVLKAFGHDITPGDLNKLATAHGLIDANGNVTRWDWLAVLFPTVLKFVEVKDWSSSLADLKYLNIRNDINTEIIIEIDDSPSTGLQTHFMRTIGWDGGTDVIVDDSWDGVRRTVNAYGVRWNPHKTAAQIIYKAIKYVRGTPPKAVVTPAPVQVKPVAPVPPKPTPVVVTEPTVQSPVPSSSPSPSESTPTPVEPTPAAGQGSAPVNYEQSVITAAAKANPLVSFLKAVWKALVGK